jgi:hypothetical protein
MTVVELFKEKKKMQVSSPSTLNYQEQNVFVIAFGRHIGD